MRALHGYVYLRWIRPYVRTLLRLGAACQPAPRVNRWMANRYHGKVIPHDHATAIVALDHDITAPNQEQIVPFPIARDIILKAPLSVVVFKCPCRLNRETHCTPTQVCMVIGEPMAGFVLDHHPDSARRLTRTEAVELLAAEHARGHVHTAWFKDAALNRFYAICNCCKCCCAGIQAMMEWDAPVLMSSGFVAEIDQSICARCGECVRTCAFGAVALSDDGAARHWDRCMGCGACEAKCATGAIQLVRDEKKGTPLDVREMA